jgi:hypothetical protein
MISDYARLVDFGLQAASEIDPQVERHFRVTFDVEDVLEMAGVNRLRFGHAVDVDELSQHKLDVVLLEKLNGFLWRHVTSFAARPRLRMKLGEKACDTDGVAIQLAHDFQ